ncbi:unnamed protein product [Urochloa humidicola]
MASLSLCRGVCKLEGFSLLAYGCIVCCKKRRHPRPFNHRTRQTTKPDTVSAFELHVEGPSLKKEGHVEVPWTISSPTFL